LIQHEYEGAVSCIAMLYGGGDIAEIIRLWN